MSAGIWPGSYSIPEGVSEQQKEARLRENDLQVSMEMKTKVFERVWQVRSESL